MQEMKIQKYHCDRCDYRGQVNIEEHADVMTVVLQIEDDHKAHSPECPTETSKIRVEAKNGALDAYSFSEFADMPGRDVLEKAVMDITRVSYDKNNPEERMLHDSMFGTLVRAIIAAVKDGVVTIQDYKDALDMAEYYLSLEGSGLRGAEAGRNSRAKLIEILEAKHDRDTE